MKRVSHSLLMIVTVCAFAACTGMRSTSTNLADIQGKWELTSLDGKELKAGKDGTYTLSFNADSTIAGRADCNYYAGKYTSTEEEGGLNLSSVSTTKANCGKQSEFATFIKSVQNAQSFQVQEGGTQLVLSGGAAKKVVFTRVEAEEES